MPTQLLQPTLRFAPSPTGKLHIGHALSALINQRIAQNMDGRLLLRIEDIDTGRRRQTFVDGIFRDLEWLGLEWDGPVLMQSERFEIYRHYLEQLKDMGLLYACFATRKEILEAARAKDSGTDPEGAPLYPQIHKDMSASEFRRRTKSGEPFALRLDMGLAVQQAREKIPSSQLSYQSFDTAGHLHLCTIDPVRWGDVVLGRKDNGTSYHIACTVDDALQGVTHVVRGQDLRAATDIHRVLQILLDLAEPLYHHHDLILDDAGRKLSKSLGDVSLQELREAGFNPDDIKARVNEFLDKYCDPLKIQATIKPQKNS